MKRLLAALPLLLAFLATTATPVHAQYTTVSAQVQDPNGANWANCTVNLSYVPSPTATTQALLSGSTFQTAIPAVRCDSFGRFIINTPGVADNNQIQDGHTGPTASQWAVNVRSDNLCFQGQIYAFTTQLTITGATQDISSALQAAAPVLPNCGGGGGPGCASTFVQSAMLYAPTTTTCGSTAFLYYLNGAVPSTGFCQASAIPVIPALYTTITTADSCLTSLYFATENFSGNQIAEVTPALIAVAALAGGGSSTCPDASLIQNQISVCGVVSGMNYPWNMTVSAANTLSLSQLSGAAITFDNTGAITVPGGCFISVGVTCGGLSGLTTDGILYADSPTHATTIPPPSTNNGQYNCGYTVTANTAVTPSCYQIGLASRSVTGSTDTVLYTDNNQTVEYQGSGAVAVTLPTPTSLQNAAFFSRLENLTTGSATAVTVTPATWTINGAAALTIPQNQSCRIGVDPKTATNWLVVCEQSQHLPLSCGGLGLGDGVNAISAATYPLLGCVNKSGSTWTITAISCYTDNNGSSTLDVKNNAGTSFLSGTIICNNTKTGGGAAGTLGGTITVAANDALNFSFVADGSSKTTTWTVGFLQ